MAEFRTQLRETSNLCVEERPGPCTMVIFGASGDLARRKLIPAVYNLHRRELLPEKFEVVGFARSGISDVDFRARVVDAVRACCLGVSSREVERFSTNFHYQRGEYNDAEAYRSLARTLSDFGARRAAGGCHVFYLATPPRLAPEIVAHLAGAGLLAECTEGPACSRVVVEKPFGFDLASARELDQRLAEHLDERQIYRIDHYVGKETVQNMLMFRFANAIFEPVWDAHYIDQVQITTAESEGVEGRAGYFDEAGALRDVFQNHMLQMMATVAMEPPSSFDAKSVRDEKTRILRAIRHIDPSKPCAGVVRGQYEGYPAEEGVAPGSQTETYVAAELRVENTRWQGVPFYLRTGKRLCRRASEIAIFFRRVHDSMFAPFLPDDICPNVLVFNVQPDEGVSLSIQAKGPGPKLCMGTLSMEFRYRAAGLDLPDAYERLLLDCMQGDQTLFIRSDALEAAWSIVDPIRRGWDAGLGCPLIRYPAGSEGPAEAASIPARIGRAWRPI
ncbi:MAG: glucose-6-phosphate dehydrogenase [Proteobacteria bacterium]|nr:glucose-6-phosphate dehydrogenase [Pseudomonadota bacterium]